MGRVGTETLHVTAAPGVAPLLQQFNLASHRSCLFVTSNARGWYGLEMPGRSVALCCCSLVPVVCSFAADLSAPLYAVRKAQIGQASGAERGSIIITLL